MKKVKQSELKKYLSTKSDVELKKEILELFKLYPNVQEYYYLKIYPEKEEEIMEKYLQIIRDEFFPERGVPTLRYSIMRKAISDFKKISKTPKNIAELMMSYVEFGVDFTNVYGDISARFYNSIFSMYEKTISYILKNNLQQYFKERCRKVMEKSRGIGWGFGDDMECLYYENFED
ncbi:hypothetical protein BBF96_04340 [Anoxybacter fermentans]|uniref:Uncharacterized protein n=1 Tax=Anoxybacter fermentans TaxID=1323375 RepID=A0A3Q9HPE0_9FIRM|nr:DUF6155 family protein [Anoxybacter fermentans]AZR72686.1 hypothetical protein BBF96_04340 [Anoxybacter fermentans]